MSVSILAILLVVGCAVGYSLLDLLRKLLTVHIRPLPLLFLLAAGPVPVFLFWWVIEGQMQVMPGYWIPGLSSALLNIGANLAFLEAVRVSPLSLTIPVLSLTPVFTTLLAVPLLGETPEPFQFLGIIVVVAGLFRLHWDGGRDSSLASTWRDFLQEKGSPLMVLTALFWSLSLPLDKLAMANSSPAFHGLVLHAGVALGVLAILVGKGRIGELRGWSQHGFLVFLNVAVGTVALVLVLLAITQTWVGFVETLKRGIGSVLAIVWGALFFDEKPSLRVLLAVLVMAAGVAVILL